MPTKYEQELEALDCANRVALTYMCAGCHNDYCCGVNKKIAAVRQARAGGLTPSGWARHTYRMQLTIPGYWEDYSIAQIRHDIHLRAMGDYQRWNRHDPSIVIPVYIHAAEWKAAGSPGKYGRNYEHFKTIGRPLEILCVVDTLVYEVEENDCG